MRGLLGGRPAHQTRGLLAAAPQTDDQPTMGTQGLLNQPPLGPVQGEMLSHLHAMAARMGIDTNQPVDAIMQQLWDKSPTDSVGEMIDTLSGRLGVPPPWAKK